MVQLIVQCCSSLKCSGTVVQFNKVQWYSGAVESASFGICSGGLQLGLHGPTFCVLTSRTRQEVALCGTIDHTHAPMQANIYTRTHTSHTRTHKHTHTHITQAGTHTQVRTHRYAHTLHHTPEWPAAWLEQAVK
jgi:hypothetical protein